MPKVGTGKNQKHFSYTPKGRAAASAYRKKLQAKKKKSKAPSGKTNQSNNSKNNVKINAEEIEKSILQIVKFAEKLASNKETRSYLKAMNDLNDAVYNGKNELYSILLNKFKKSGIKA